MFSDNTYSDSYANAMLGESKNDVLLVFYKRGLVFQDKIQVELWLAYTEIFDDLKFWSLSVKTIRNRCFPAKIVQGSWFFLTFQRGFKCVLTINEIWTKIF